MKTLLLLVAILMPSASGAVYPTSIGPSAPAYATVTVATAAVHAERSVRASEWTISPARPSLTGNATWYDAPSIHDAAAGPNLRKALGSHWRNTIVRVSSGGHSVTVRLSDFCRCSQGNRLIDLDNLAFERLAPLSVGVIPVRIAVIGAIDEPVSATAPPTDVQ